MVKLTGEDLRVAVSEEMPFAYEELGESPSLSALLKYMKSHLREANFASNTEELRNILLDYVENDINESIYKQMDAIDDKESLNEKYNVSDIRDVKKLAESVTTDNNMEKLQSAAARVKCKLTPGFIEYATEDPDMLDAAIEDELLYCGETLCNEFPEMISWEFGEDDDLTDQYGSYCVVDTGTDEGRILVQIDGHGRIYNLE